MTNKKNKFWTFCFSMIPGAGEMYLGFYKMGISLMAVFGIFTSIAGFFELSASLFFLPVIWFYSFFHVHNLNSLPDEEFYALEDDWLIHIDRDTFVLNDWIMKYRKLIAGIMILFGVSILWNILSNFLYGFMRMLQLPDSVRYFINRTSSTIPQGVIALLIIILGMKLIKNKKDDLQSEDDSVIPAPPYIEVKQEEKKDSDQN